MLANDHIAGRDHRFFVERIGVMPHVSRQERRTNRTAMNPVAIGLRSRRFARMKAKSGLGHFQHPYRWRQNMIQCLRPVFGGNAGCSLKGRDLGQRMNPGIGAARSLGQYIFATQTSNSRSQCALNGREPGLHLPASKLGAVIRKDQFEIAHALFRVPHGPIVIRVFIGFKWHRHEI